MRKYSVGVAWELVELKPDVRGDDQQASRLTDVKLREFEDPA
jgi:hypothetical protein